MKKTLFYVTAALWFVLSSACPRYCCTLQTTDNACVLDGTWVLNTIFDDSFTQEDLVFTVGGPFLAVKSAQGYCAPGFVVPKVETEGCILLWRYHRGQATYMYKGSTRLDPCSSGSTDVEPVIAGTVTMSSRAAGIQRGKFSAYQRTTLRIVVTPEDSGTVIADGTSLSCSADCSEQYLGACRKLTLVAKPTAGWIFKYWQVGQLIREGDPRLDIRINTDLTVSAVFQKEGT